MQLEISKMFIKSAVWPIKSGGMGHWKTSLMRQRLKGKVITEIIISLSGQK